jgi:hypothetical protein
MQKRLAVLGLTAGLVGGSLAGFALASPGLVGAQSSDTPSTSTPSTANPSTANPSTAKPSTPPNRPDPSAWARKALDPLVANGTITQAQEDAVVAALQDAEPDRPGFGRMGADHDLAAKALGISADELRSDLRNGQTLAQIAQAKGIDPQTVVDALVAGVKADLDSRVAAGDLTQDQADQRLAGATGRITELVNGQLPFERGHRGGPGPWGDSHTSGDNGTNGGDSNGAAPGSTAPATTPSSATGNGSSTSGSGSNAGI